VPRSLAERPSDVRAARTDAAEHHHDFRTVVTVRRDDPGDVGQRQVFARLDGGPRVALVFGDAVSIELRPGAHHLHVHNTLFWKNLHFSIETGEHLEFVLINRARWWTAGVVGVLGAAPLFLTVVQRRLR
jgi:hypothetical protein